MEAISTAAIDKILGIAPAIVLEVDGFKYFDKDHKVSLITPPVPAPIHLHTLTGFIGLLENGFEGFDPAQCIVQVDAFDEVSLLSSKSDAYGRRQVFVTAKALKPENAFKFNQYMSQESFVIGLMSQFVSTDGSTELLANAGNLTAQTAVQQEDDGVTQRVVVKAGIVKNAEVTVKPRVTLQPFRTFLDVEQPKSDYIYRVKAQEGVGNTCALFEADGGYWKLNAMETIKAWLQNKLRGLSNSPLNDLPVVA